MRRNILLTLATFCLIQFLYSSENFNLPETLKRSEEGDSEAQNSLAKYYLKEKKESTALAWFTKSAEQGNLKAQFNLAACYQNGIGTEKNIPKAVEWFTKAAESGDADAMIQAGWYYQTGKGTEQNTVKAFELYTKAAELKNLSGKVYLACCYRYGIGTEKNELKAFELFKEAVELGEKNATMHLARCYRDGTGTKEDLAKALELFKKAGEQGNTHAQDEIQALQRAIQRSTSISFTFLIILIAIVLEGILILLYRKWNLLFINGEDQQISSSVFLFVLFLPLIASALMLLLLSSYFLISISLQMLIIESICIIVFAYILKNQGRDFCNSFSLKKISAYTFISWILIGGSIILLVNLTYMWLFYMFKNADQSQLIAKLASKTSSVNVIRQFIMPVMLAPIVEELVFRGIIYQSLKSKMHVWIAIVLSSLIFAIIQGSISDFILGILLAYSLEKTKSLYVPICLHCLNNAVAFALVFTALR